MTLTDTPVLTPGGSYAYVSVRTSDYGDEAAAIERIGREALDACRDLLGPTPETRTLTRAELHEARISAAIRASDGRVGFKYTKQGEKVSTPRFIYEAYLDETFLGQKLLRGREYGSDGWKSFKLDGVAEVKVITS